MEEVTAKDLAFAVGSAKNELILALTSGRIDTTDTAILRRKHELLEEMWTTQRKAVLRWYGGPALSKKDRVQQWVDAALKEARTQVAYETLPGMFDKVLDKKLEYYAYVEQVQLNFKVEFAKVLKIRDEHEGTETEYTGNPEGPRLVKILTDSLLEWFDQHYIDEWFLRKTPRDAMNEFLLERKDMLALYNFILDLPPRKTVNEVEIERPLLVEAVELAVGFIPVVGNGIALYESYTGRDLFGYRLTNLERGILAASCLLPVAGRLVKGGRAMYTNARLVKLYGRDAALWQRTVERSGRALESKGALRAVRNADDALRASGKLEGKVAKEAAEALPKVLHSSSRVILEAEKEIKVIWETLANKFPALADLDELAIRRIVRKGTNVDHIKGQLLEELLESYVLPMLRKRQAAFALGLKVPKGATVEFIPGHLIRTSSGKAGRQITDGMLGFYDKGVFNIVGIFEAKAGRTGARELSFTKTKIADLTGAEKKELRAFANNVWFEEKEIAETAGKTYTKTIEAVEQEVRIFYLCFYSRKLTLSSR